MTPEQKARAGRLAAFSLLLLLMAMLLLETVLQPLPPAAMTFVVALKLLPLAFFLKPMWQGRSDSALWLSMFLMPYFCWAGMGVFAPGADGKIALLRALLIGACFAAALLMMRWQRAAAFTQSR
jgi:uncharacterized membrane protein